MKTLRQQSRAKREQVHAQVLAILTPEQRQQIEAKRQEMEQRRQERRTQRRENRNDGSTDKPTDN
jgi:Spy/CpxP family protein refolding chaperone